MYRLISYDTFPPGGFSYSDPNTGKRFGGSGYGIREQATRVSEFRRANRFSRPSVLECLEDIDAFTCNRLGNAAQFVRNTDVPISQGSGLPESAPCSTCGAALPT